MLLTEKFTRLQFFMPFPTYDITMESEIEKCCIRFQFFEKLLYFLYLGYSNQFWTNMGVM